MADVRRNRRKPGHKKPAYNSHRPLQEPKICSQYMYNREDGCSKGDQCNFLHICRYHILGNCRSRNGCRFSHDLQSGQVQKLLQRKYGISSMDQKTQNEFRKLYGAILRNNPDDSEENSEESRRFKREKLIAFLTSFSETTGKSLQTWRENASSAINVPVCTSKEVLFICPYYLKGHCKFDDDKFKHRRHFKSPYQWQFKNTMLTLDADWQDFGSLKNNEIENAYNDVNNSVYNLPSCGTFFFDEGDLLEGVSIGDGLVRRLSTSSSVTKSDWEKAFCIEWLWYWLDENGSWIRYSDQSAKGVQAGLDSTTIEHNYVKYKNDHSESEVDFTAGAQSYKLDLDAMQQTNVRYRTVKEVRRRPNFVSMKDRKVTSRQMSQSQNVGIAVPSTWENVGESRRLIPLHGNPPEYNSIVKLFEKTMSTTASIVSVARIQNKELWEDFSKMKERMKKKNKGRPVFQMQLFHGTTNEYTDAICSQNFDWRLSGSSVGRIYGHGSYFARDAQFAHSYTKSDHLGHRYVFVAQVLVGDQTKGDSSYVRPPPKDPSQPLGELYDSCVDDVRNPQIYVTFEKTQVYPEYLITYKEKSGSGYSSLSSRASSSTSYGVPPQNQYASSPPNQSGYATLNSLTNWQARMSTVSSRQASSLVTSGSLTGSNAAASTAAAGLHQRTTTGSAYGSSSSQNTPTYKTPSHSTPSRVTSSMSSGVPPQNHVYSQPKRSQKESKCMIQ